MSTTISVVCYKSKVLSNNESPLMLRICKDGKRKYESLGISVLHVNWNFSQNRPTRNCPNREYIERLIADKIKMYTDKLIELKTSSNEFTVTSLMKNKSKSCARKTLLEVFNTYIDDLKLANRLRYADMFRCTLNSLLKYDAHLDVPFSEINISWLKRYKIWLQHQGLSTNTIGTRFRHLRVIYNVAIEEKIVKAENYPFEAFKISKLSQATAKRAIPKDDILAILSYQGKTPMERLAIDLFTFSYLTAGTNFVDMARMTKNNLIDNRLVYIRKKTKKQITVPLHAQAVELVEKYANSESPYLFPILSTFHKTEQQKLNRIHKIISKVNKLLKGIGGELGISIDLTTYVARHSYATVLKRSGVSTSIISESLGHSSERVTQIYLDSFDNEQINEAMKNLL